VLIRLRGSDKELADFLKNHPNTTVVDRLVGEWNFLVEFVSDISTFYAFLAELKTRFSAVLDVFEVHPELEAYRVQQLPGQVKPALSKRTEKVELDDADLKLLFELNKDCTASLLELAKRLGVTYETVSSRIKSLRKKGVIVEFTAKINLHALGYDVYLVMLDLRNLSKERESALRFYINDQKNIRYAFMSASKPVVFIYLAVKKSDELGAFLLDIKEKFSDVIVNQKYLFSSMLLKHEFFPEGLLN